LLINHGDHEQTHEILGTVFEHNPTTMPYGPRSISFQLRLIWPTASAAGRNQSAATPRCSYCRYPGYGPEDGIVVALKHALRAPDRLGCIVIAEERAHQVDLVLAPAVRHPRFGTGARQEAIMNVNVDPDSESRYQLVEDPRYVAAGLHGV
jgi:hypothetical protein